VISVRLISIAPARWALTLIACAVACSGCATHRVLSKNTAAANLTTSDIYYQQVLSNLARFSANPASMPSFAVISSGTVNVQDNQQASISPTYSPTLTAMQQGGGALPILSLLFGFNASRSLTENWSTSPVTDSDNLRRIRCAFQYLVGQGTSTCDECEERLKGFIVGGTESFECMLPRGWFHVGSEDDVPCNACFEANYCDTYVWVMPDGMDGLTRFTITILDLATGEIRAPHRTVVKKYKGEPDPGNLESTEVTFEEVDQEALKRTERFRQDRVRPDSPGINRGLFFVPR
jgi:hypothetical protein